MSFLVSISRPGVCMKAAPTATTCTLKYSWLIFQCSKKGREKNAQSQQVPAGIQPYTPPSPFSSTKSRTKECN